jgi:hypothetical protein
VADERYASLFELLGVPVERVCIGGTTRLVAAPLGTVAERILADWPEARRIFGSQSAASRSPTRKRTA